MDFLHTGSQLDNLPEPMKIHLPSQEVLEIAPLDQDDDFNTSLLANQNKALAVENMRLARDNMFMRLQSQGMAPMSYAEVPEYVQNLWDVPRIGLHPQWCRNDMNFAKAAGWAAPKMGIKQRGLHAKRDSIASDSTASGDFSSFNSSMLGDEPDLETTGSLSSTPPHMRTTVMMRNLPNNLDREQLLQLVDNEGFEGSYNLVYLPIDFKSKAGLGYAFIDFQRNEDAERFFEVFQDFTKWTMGSDKICNVTWSVALQGIDEHVKRYRNSPVMHESVPEEFRPVLFKEGKRVPFPEPTKRIRAPRQWPRRH